MTRPYFNLSGPELQDLVRSSLQNKPVLRSILEELDHRVTPSSQALKEEVRRLLGMEVDLLSSIPQRPSVMLTLPKPAGIASAASPSARDPQVESLALRDAAPPPSAADESSKPVHQDMEAYPAPPTPAIPRALPSSLATEGVTSGPPESALPGSLTDALRALQLTGSQSWAKVEQQRRKLVSDVLASERHEVGLGPDQVCRVGEINAAARRVFEALYPERYGPLAGS